MKQKIKKLTLIELVGALIVFLILASVIMGIFNSINKNLSIAEGERDIYERARIALDVISKDIQCAYYGDETAPFWHHSSVSSWGEYNNELLALVSTTPYPSNNYSSDLFEVKYQLYYTTDISEDTSGWILRSVTGNLTDSTTVNTKWNFNNNFTVGETGNSFAFSADTSSSDEYSKLIPYVTKLTFKCYGEDGVELDSDINDTTCNVTNFPYTIDIKMTLMDRISWNKWISTGGTPHDLENDPAANLRRKNERSFTQSVLIGNRGQSN
jgi:hypothetical protein